MQAAEHEGYTPRQPERVLVNVQTNNNNHMRCWHCQLVFCFLCKEAIKVRILLKLIDRFITQGSAHFIGGQCKQHTV